MTKSKGTMWTTVQLLSKKMINCSNCFYIIQVTPKFFLFWNSWMKFVCDGAKSRSQSSGTWSWVFLPFTVLTLEKLQNLFKQQSLFCGLNLGHIWCQEVLIKSGFKLNIPQWQWPMTDEFRCVSLSSGLCLCSEWGLSALTLQPCWFHPSFKCTCDGERMSKYMDWKELGVYEDEGLSSLSCSSSSKVCFVG